MKKIIFWVLVLAAIAGFFALAARSVSIKDPQIKSYVEEYETLVQEHARAIRQAVSLEEKRAALSRYADDIKIIVEKWNNYAIEANDDFRKAQVKINSLNKKMMALIRGLSPEEKVAP